MKNFLINCILLIVSLAVAFLFAEIIFRFSFQGNDHLKIQRPQVFVHQTSDNLKLLYRPVPYAQNLAYGVDNKINSMGFRDYEYPPEKSDKVTRVIFLGDSVVYGYGLELDDSLPKQLESCFQKKGYSVEVLNLGVSGYDTEQAVEFFKEIGLGLHPDIVILGYTLNDVMYASLEMDFFHDQHDYHLRIPKRGIRQRFLGFLYKHFKIMDYFDRKFLLQQKYKKLRSYEDVGIWHYIENRNALNRDPESSAYQQVGREIEKEGQRLGLGGADIKKMLGFAGIGNDAMYSSHWNLSVLALEELEALSRRHNFKVYAVIFPYMLDLNRYALLPMHHFLSEEFSRMGFEVIDLFPWIQEKYREFGDQIKDDPIHFSALGAKLSAGYICDFIKNQKDFLTLKTSQEKRMQ